MECLGQLEMFLHMEAKDLPLLLRAALAHVHPGGQSTHSLDGNGRLGRLLITFLLCAGGALSERLLDPLLESLLQIQSLVYYDLLTSVRTSGNWKRGSSSS